MVKIRLSRFGKKKTPFYRIVVVDERSKLKGKFLEVVGYWDPQKNKKTIKKESIKKWMGKGAKLSQAVQKLLT